MEHGEGEDGRKRCLGKGHRCCIAESDIDVGVGDALTKRASQDGINLEASNVLIVVLQPVGRNARPGSDFQNSPVHIQSVEDPRKDVAFEASPPTL